MQHFCLPLPHIDSSCWIHFNKDLQFVSYKTVLLTLLHCNSCTSNTCKVAILFIHILISGRSSTHWSRVVDIFPSFPRVCLWVPSGSCSSRNLKNLVDVAGLLAGLQPRELRQKTFQFLAQLPEARPAGCFFIPAAVHDFITGFGVRWIGLGNLWIHMQVFMAVVYKKSMSKFEPLIIQRQLMTCNSTNTGLFIEMKNVDFQMAAQNYLTVDDDYILLIP